MTLAVLTIVISVVLGTLLALLPRKKDGWMGPMRTFGLAAALSVVLFHMIPESLDALGLWVVPALGLGIALPGWLGRLGTLVWRAGHQASEPGDWALEAGYAGLLLHKVGDGVALGVYAGEIGAAGSSGFAAALAAHIVPVVAIVVLTFDSVRGRGSALWRAVGLAGAGVFGVVITQSAIAGPMSSAHGLLSAVAAGMLLHVVTHDLGVELPKTPAARLLDCALAALGLAVGGLGDGGHGHGGEDASHAAAGLLHALLQLTLATLPFLLLGLVLGALLSTLGLGRETRWARTRRILGARARPFALDVETFTVSVPLLGWGLSLARLVGAALVALAARAFTLGWHEPELLAAPAPGESSPDQESWTKHFARSFEQRWLHVAAWMTFGLVLAALLEISLPDQALARIPSGIRQYLVVTAVAVPISMCSPALAPLAFVLIEKGLSPGATLVGLLLGPSMSLSSLWLARRQLGLRAAALGLCAAIATSWTLAACTEVWLGGVPPLAAASDALSDVARWDAAQWDYREVLSVLALAVLLWSAYRVGFRGLLLPLEGGHDHELGPFSPSAGSVQDHGHAHGHGPVRESGAGA